MLVPYVIFVRFIESGKALCSEISIPEQIIYYFLRVDRFWHCIVVHSLLSFGGRAFPLGIGSAAHARTVSPRLIVGLRAWKSLRRAKHHSTHNSS